MSQSSSFLFPQISASSDDTVGSRSSQSLPPLQCPSMSPSPSASRGSCVHDFVASSHASIVHGVGSEQPTGAPGTHPSFVKQRSTPSQKSPSWHVLSSGEKRQ